MSEVLEDKLEKLKNQLNEADVISDMISKSKDERNNEIKEFSNQMKQNLELDLKDRLVSI